MTAYSRIDGDGSGLFRRVTTSLGTVSGMRAALILALILTLGQAFLPNARAYAECKKKTAGYFLQLTAADASAPEFGDRSGIAESLTGTRGNAAKGREVVADRRRGNCLACHRIAVLGDLPDHGDIGPSLNGIAGRYNEAQLRQIIVDVRALFPNTVMPAFYKRKGLHQLADKYKGETILTANEVEDVVAFLETLR